MVACDRRDLVCLYLDAHGAPPEQSPAPPALTATGIGDALELGDAAAARVGLLDDLSSLEADGLLTSREQAVTGYSSPRTVYVLTDAGRDHAASVRDDVGDQVVEVTDGETERVPLADVGRYLEDEPAPMVTALTRLTTADRVSVDRPTSDAFVDRTSEVAAVRESIAASFTRDNRTVFVSGPAGIGKTALVREAIDRVADDHDALVDVRGDCPPVPTGPYEPIRRAFQQLPDDGAVLDRLAAARRAVGPDDPATVDARRTALFDDVADGVRAAATDRPVVIFLDDLQWADEATLELFAHLATSITEWLHPVAFVGTYRATTVTTVDDHPLGEILDRIDETTATTEVRLGALSGEDTATLLESVLGRHHVPEDFVGLVQDRTGGNPLFVRETATHLLETGALDPETDAFPTSPEAVSLPEEVTEQISRRLAGLDDTSRELLRLGAVLGERFPEAVLAEAADLEPARRREYVDVLVAVHIWTRAGGDERAPTTDAGTPSAPDRELQFVSGGFREAVVERLTTDVTRSLHERVADAYGAVYGDDDAVAARVAHHYEAAGDDGAAVAAYRRAGDDAKATYAHDDALDSYERALALAREHDADLADTRAAIRADVAEVHRLVGAYDEARETIASGLAVAPDESRARCRLLGVRAEVLVGTGDYDEARTTVERQRDLAVDLGARELEMAAVRRLGRVAMERAAYDEARDRYRRSLETARAIGDRAGEATCLKQLGSIARQQGDYDGAREHLEGSLELYRELGDRRGEANSLGNLGVVAIFAGDLDRAREYVERSLEVKRELGDRPGQARSLNNLGLVAVNQNAYERARDYYERSLDVERELGNRVGEAQSLNNLGVVAEARGEWERARERYERSLAIQRDLGDRFEEAHSRNNLGVVALRQGDLDRARAQLERSLAIKRDIGDRAGQAETLVNLAKVALAGDDLGRAADRLATAWEVGEDVGARHALAEHQLVAGRLALARGDPSTARDRGADARERFEDLAAPHWVGRTHRLLGRVDAAAGSPDAARDHWRAALDVFEEVDAPHDALATLEPLVATCREQGDGERASAWCREALSLLESAPEPVVEQHEDWVRRRAADLDVT